MNFIKKIFDGKIDNSVHLQFEKFSRGEFRNKALVKAKNSGGKYTISTTYEFANGLVGLMAEKLGNNKTRVTGAVITTLNLKEDPSFSKLIGSAKIKQFMGVKQYQLNLEMTGSEILELLNKSPKAFFALSLKVGEEELKIKAKAPKSAKPSTKGDAKPNPDFCKLITKDKNIAASFVFEKPEFKQALISHDFLINEIVMPKGESDFAKIRELAKRKGTIVRETEIDGQKLKKEVSFEA